MLQTAVTLNVTTPFKDKDKLCGEIKVHVEPTWKGEVKVIITSMQDLLI